jgi:phosphotransferase system HPr (HPr) family protein
MSIKHTFLKNITGRTAQTIVSYVSKLTDTIYFEKDERRINAASLLGLLSLYITMGETVTITARGINEESESKTLGDFMDYMRSNEL